MTPSNSRTLAMLAPLALLLLPACSTRVADLTLVSTRNVDLSNARLDARTGTRVKGSHCSFFLPNMEDAVDDALTKGNGNVLVDQVTYYKSYPFVDCFEVEGTVLNTSSPR